MWLCPKLWLTEPLVQERSLQENGPASATKPKAGVKEWWSPPLPRCLFSLGRLCREAIHNAVSKANNITSEIRRKIYSIEIVDKRRSTIIEHLLAKRSLSRSASEEGLFSGGGSCNPSKSSEILDLSPPDIRLTTLMDVEFQSVPKKWGKNYLLAVALGWWLFYYIAKYIQSDLSKII